MAAGITKKITFHCTRHSFGKPARGNGYGHGFIQAYLGHKNITTTQIYSKMAAQQMCEVVDKITLKRKEA
ncbi:tyrosine-type recombinase/integrase [Phocaeicola dorei]|uniref:tyrosine-type recombinase/integrase n=1 Tax=Phocaeicola dorei TaxID=357276 RepID=UPI00211E6A18|nr:tyrosine-type recombinase/integrase [Phocaeicola dorei]